MKRSVVVLAAMLVVSGVAIVPMAGLAGSHGDRTPESQEPTDENASVAPGERLGGVVGVGQAELDGEIDERAFGLEIARAASNESAADVVASRFDRVEERLGEIERRKAAVEAAREAGDVSEGKYRAEMARLAAETEHAERMANRTEMASRGLPAELLADRGVDVDALQTLRERASELGGPAVSEIARGIAGPDVGADVGRERGGDPTPEAPDGPVDHRPGEDRTGENGLPSLGNDTERPDSDDVPNATGVSSEDPSISADL